MPVENHGTAAATAVENHGTVASPSKVGAERANRRPVESLTAVVESMAAAVENRQDFFHASAESRRRISRPNLPLVQLARDLTDAAESQLESADRIAAMVAEAAADAALMAKHGRRPWVFYRPARNGADGALSVMPAADGLVIAFDWHLLQPAPIPPHVPFSHYAEWIMPAAVLAPILAAD